MAIQNILLAVGPNDAERIEDLCATVVDIAGPTGATVTIGHVFTDEQYAEVVDRLEFPSTAEADPDAVAERHATVRDLSDRLKEAGIDHVARGAVGEHGEEIVNMAKDADADLVIVGGRKRSPTGKAVFGSTAQEVMLNAPAPVTFVRSGD